TVSNAASFSVAACGLGQLYYQWRHASTNLPGATNAVFSIPSTRTNDSGSYYVVVTNNAGALTSALVNLTVTPYVIIPDPNLTLVLMSALGKTTCNLTAPDIGSLTNLYAANANITNLTGLAAASNLKSLHLGGNAISDLTPLQSLNGL